MSPKRFVILATASTLMATAAFQASRAQQQEAPPPSVSSRWAKHDSGSRQSVAYEVVDRILETFVIADGRGRTAVPFERLKGEGQRALVTMMDAFQKLPVEKLNRDEQLAFWLNLRTLYVLHETIGAYPLRRPEALLSGGSNLLSAKKVTVSGEPLSIADIDRLVLANWPEPHVIYGLSLPVKDAPGLPRTAFTGATVHDLLKAAGRDFVNRSGTVRVRDGRTEVSGFYDWHDARATGGPGLADHLRTLAAPKLAQRLAGTATPGKQFDWSLTAEQARSLDGFALDRSGGHAGAEGRTGQYGGGS
jgi:hypothetical protein